MQLWPTTTKKGVCVISADNGVYILKTRKGSDYEYRVATIYAIGNIFKDIFYLFNAFEHAEVFASHKEAEKLAFETDKVLMSEYDVLVIDHFVDQTWDDIRVAATGTGAIDDKHYYNRHADESGLHQASQAR